MCLVYLGSFVGLKCEDYEVTRVLCVPFFAAQFAMKGYGVIQFAILLFFFVVKTVSFVIVVSRNSAT